jgi:Predicted membrane protein
MQLIETITLPAFIIWNIVTFFLYGVDKFNAMNNRWRIPNKSLLLCAFFFGGIGAFFGMRIFRHKTKTKEFVILVPIGAIVSLLLGYYFIGL